MASEASGGCLHSFVDQGSELDEDDHVSCSSSSSLGDRSSICGAMLSRRYLTLDAMRGTAALAVFSMHAAAMTAPLTASHAFLAVDLFFIISGVVIDRVYGARIAAGLTPIGFLVNRYIRFYPLYLIGAAIGIGCALVSLVFGQGVLSATQFVTAAATALVMMPSPTSSADTFVVPFNYAAWSLIFELFINFIYVAVYRWLNPKTLVAIVFLSGATFIAAANLLETVSMGGEWPGFWGGVPRVAFSFFIGVFIARVYAGRVIVTRWAYVLAVTPFAFFLPFAGLAGDLVKVVVVFPALILAALSLEPAINEVNAKPAVLLGAISFPLYAIHVPVMQLVERACTVLHINRGAYAPFAGLALTIVLCCASLVLYHLNEKLQKRIGAWRGRRRPSPMMST